VGFTAYLAVGWLPAYPNNLFFPSTREKISQHESDRQPLHSKIGTSPLLPGSLRSSRTSTKGKWCLNDNELQSSSSSEDNWTFKVHLPCIWYCIYTLLPLAPLEPLYAPFHKPSRNWSSILILFQFTKSIFWYYTGITLVSPYTTIFPTIQICSITKW
jgi:hypothetical protein